MTELTLSQRTLHLPRQHPRLFLLVAAILWLALYQALIPASEALVAALPVDRDSHLGGALQFFFYDTPKVLLLLTAVVCCDRARLSRFFIFLSSDSGDSPCPSTAPSTSFLASVPAAKISRLWA